MIVTNYQILVFFLIVTRFAGMFIVAPIFSRKEVFLVAKVALIFWMSGLLMMVIPFPTDMIPSPWYLVPVFGAEFLVGYMIGFITDLLVTCVEFAGTLMDTQAGLSVASLLDPSSGRQITVIAIFLKWTALITFLLIDGHHLVLSSLVQSFQVIPVGGIPNLGEGARYLTTLGTYIFQMAVQLAAPIILVIFLVDFGFGMLNKVAEQVNVFQLGFQIKPTVSMIIFLATAPLIVENVTRILERTSEEIVKVFIMLQV